MSSTNRSNIPVKMVHIQWSDKPNPSSYKNNVTVSLPKDPRTQTAYLRITVNQESILSEELNRYKWLEDSCSNGVVAINSTNAKILILYDTKDKMACDIFAEMKALLQQGSINPPPQSSPTSRLPPTTRPSPTTRPQGQIDLATNDLIKFIQEGSSDKAIEAVKYLARSRPNIQFGLSYHNDNEENKIQIKSSGAKSSINSLQLTLRIECHLYKEPLVTTIYVRPGTDLRTLKTEIEEKTGIKYRDQYWYAFDQYIINDDYKFGSSDSVVPPLPRNAPRRQKIPPNDPIRSGDTLVLYVANTPPFEK